jgi:hypothetical protein
MTDRAKVVRYRALSLVAYSLRDDALPALARTHSGKLTWNVKPDEAETQLLSRGERSPVRPGQGDPEIPVERTGPLPAATRGARR